MRIHTYYRWEFIRRSQLYQDDFKSFFVEFKPWLDDHGFDFAKFKQKNPQYWTHFQKDVLRDSGATQFFQENVAPYLYGFMLKWGLSYPQDPDHVIDNPGDLSDFVTYGLPAPLPLDDEIDLSIPIKELSRNSTTRFKIAQHFVRQGNQVDNSAPYRMSIYISNRIGTAGQYDLFSLTENQLKKTKEIIRELPNLYEKSGYDDWLDLPKNAKDSVFQLLKAFIDFIEINREIILWPIVPRLGKSEHVSEFNRILKTVNFRKISGTNPSIKRAPHSKIHLGKLREYLLVWDSKTTQPHVTNLELAQRLFGNEYDEYADPEALTRRILRALLHAKRLIDGGFRQIR